MSFRIVDYCPSSLRRKILKGQKLWKIPNNSEVLIPFSTRNVVAFAIIFISLSASIKSYRRRVERENDIWKCESGRQFSSTKVKTVGVREGTSLDVRLWSDVPLQLPTQLLLVEMRVRSCLENFTSNVGEMQSGRRQSSSCHRLFNFI